MAITIKRTAKGIPYINAEFRKSYNKRKFYYSQTIHLDKDLTKAKLMQQANLLYGKFVEECEKKMKLGIEESTNSITLSRFIDDYLEYVKNNYSPAHYSDFSNSSIFVKERIGHIKLKDLTPMIIQNFYNEVAKRKRKTKIIVPRDDFNKTISKYNFVGMRIFEITKCHKKYICLAKKGEKVSKEWATIFANYLNLPFDKLFKEIEIEQEYSYVMKKKVAVFLRACLTEAKRKLLISENYAKSEYAKFMKNPEPNKEKDILKEDDFFKLYDYILKSDDIMKKTFFVIMLNTGARKEEVLGLRWNKIDLINKELEFSTTVTRASKVGLIINENKTKNSSSNRKISLSEETITILLKYKKYYDEKFYDDKNGFLFKNPNGNVIYPDTINRWLNSLLKKAGLEHHTVHSLRHSYASLMINHLPLADVSKRIGHSQISTTLNFYAHQITKQNQVKDLKNIVNGSYYEEIINSLNVLKQYQIINDIEYQNKKELAMQLVYKNN